MNTRGASLVGVKLTRCARAAWCAAVMSHENDREIGGAVTWNEQLGYWVVTQTPRVMVAISQMLTNFRVVEVPLDCPLTYDRYWCFEGLGVLAFTTAVLAAHAWGGDPQGEPIGWIKSWDGRYGARLADDRDLPH